MAVPHLGKDFGPFPPSSLLSGIGVNRLIQGPKNLQEEAEFNSNNFSAKNGSLKLPFYRWHSSCRKISRPSNKLFCDKAQNEV